MCVSGATRVCIHVLAMGEALTEKVDPFFVSKVFIETGYSSLNSVVDEEHF